MPPEKSDPIAELIRLAEKYKIIFNGPVPPRKWPRQHTHLFQVVREIWGNRYENRGSTDLNHNIITEQDERVREIGINLTQLRKDFGILEDDWRDSIEKIVIGRFDKEVQCFRCDNEKWASEYVAQPLDEREKNKLREKRTNRRRCTCDGAYVCPRNTNKDSDEESQTRVFITTKSGVVSHDPQDGLANSKITKMRPDRVIGLSQSNTYLGQIESFHENIQPCPIKGRDHIIYPFLVIEAKREKNAPGFRSVEAKTSFPIRRFLLIQDELQRASDGKLDPLVWFFGFQGEDWRLYAATLDNVKAVQVFQLWHGNLESEDSALQIVQIVDFIWTWARDVYRPQIRRCLSRGTAYQDEVSPTSTTGFRNFPRSQTAFPDPRARTFSQPLRDAIAEDIITAQEVMSDDRSDVQEVSSDLWPSSPISGVYSASSTPQNTIIRHCDRVIFSFRILEIPEDQEDFFNLFGSSSYNQEDSMTALDVLKAILQDQFTVPLKRGDLHAIKNYWTGNDTDSPYLTSYLDQRMNAVLLFRTFCQKEDWQLVKEAFCVISSSQAANLLNVILDIGINTSFEESSQSLIQYGELFRAFQQPHQLSGNRSVANAVHKSILILTPCIDADEHIAQLEWRLPWNQGIPDTTIAKLVSQFDLALRSQDSMQPFHRQRCKPRWIISTLREAVRTDTSSGLENLIRHISATEAMLIVKPSAWSQQCPRFCLFVSSRAKPQSRAQLRNLLLDAIQQQNISYVHEGTAQEPEELTEADNDLLVSWVSSLASL